jgi:CubicO group peptidase (beta-lactamase class C family)
MSTKYLLAAALLGLAVSAGSGAHAESDARATLDRDVPKLLRDHKVPSVSIAQIRHGAIVLTAAYGEQSAGAPATTATLYNVASLTKPLTAEIVLRLASKGVLRLDEPMYKFWTDPDIAKDPRTKLLTPRLALSHQTGFPNWRDDKTGLAFLHDPGTQWGYSGEGYEYVARFAEKKTGQDFERLAQTLLFGPEGLTSTSYTAKPWFDGRVAVPADASGAALKPSLVHHYNGADFVYTTAGDYARFLTGVLKDEGLSPAIAAERARIQADMLAETCSGAKAASCPPATGFGLGWQIFAFADATFWMHTGKDEGLFTFAYLDRTSGDGAVILTNGDNGGDVVMPILERLGTSGEFVRFLKGQMGG